ncbi:exostosin family protein, partial [Flavobacterium sp.]|uniref:exostosin domain-containing protein n=1 Tax=Flavobacterium sp. TaxID=239 RepID=UPI003753E6F9
KEELKANPSYRLLIQKGKPFCSGVMFVPNNDINLQLFNPSEWKGCGTDDEHYIINFFNTRYPRLFKQVGILDPDRFPNGLKWRLNYTIDVVNKLIKEQSIDLLHFNYIAGIENKILKMTEYGMWLKQMNIINVPERFIIDINGVCLNKNHSVYPPHQKGNQIESYMYEYFSQKKTIYSEYEYLPITWTAIAVEGNTKRITDLKEWIRGFCKKNPTRKCWTVVQHCKGIEKALGIYLPSNWLIFTTSNPNAILEKPLLVKSKRNRKAKPIIIPTNNHIIIPLFSSEHFTTAENDNRDILASFIGDIHVHPLRNKLLNTNSSTIIVKNGCYKNPTDQKSFKDLMTRSKFALCPRGFGNTSFRIIEAIQFGTIPIYISDVFSLFYNDELNYNEIGILIKPDEISNIYNVLKQKTDAEITQYQNNIKGLYDKYFTMQGCCEYIIRRISS